MLDPAIQQFLDERKEAWQLDGKSRRQKPFEFEFGFGGFRSEK